MLFIFPYIMINVYYSCQTCINRKLNTCVNIDQQSVPSMPLLDQLANQRWLSFLAIDMCCDLMNGITSLENDVLDKTHLLAQHNDRSVLLLLLSSCQIHIHSTMRLGNSRIPEECLVCYQTSLRNWVIIKMLYRYLRRCLLGCIDRDQDLSLRVSERYLWDLSVMHIIISLASNVTNEGKMYYGMSKEAFR